MQLSLFSLFELLPVSKSRIVASIHGVLAGSRCNQAQLLDATINHSCLACATHSSIFLWDKIVSNFMLSVLLNPEKSRT